MCEKLGLVDTDQDVNQVETYFTDEVKTLLEELWTLMETCGSDFTNTFRDMAKVSKAADMTEADQEALVALSTKNTAPKEALLMSKKSMYESNPQI